MSALDFLRDIGKHYRVNTMIRKDAVADRLNSQEGISYTEFSYQILQGLDFLELYRRHGCVLQTGGSDQWGNLTSGVDLIHRAEGAAVHVLATPLITKADGTKYGKTEGGTVWLDPEMTSPYAFFQFWLNAEDAIVGNLLRVFTFRSHAEIEALEASARDTPHLREAQRALAQDVTTLVHGAETAAAGRGGRAGAVRPGRRRRAGRAGRGDPAGRHRRAAPGGRAAWATGWSTCWRRPGWWTAATPPGGPSPRVAPTSTTSRSPTPRRCSPERDLLAGGRGPAAARPPLAGRGHRQPASLTGGHADGAHRGAQRAGGGSNHRPRRCYCWYSNPAVNIDLSCRAGPGRQFDSL